MDLAPVSANLRRSKIPAGATLPHPKSIFTRLQRTDVLDAAFGRISNAHRATLKTALEAEIAGHQLTDAAARNDPLTQFEHRYGGPESKPSARPISKSK